MAISESHTVLARPVHYTALHVKGTCNFYIHGTNMDAKRPEPHQKQVMQLNRQWSYRRWRFRLS